MVGGLVDRDVGTRAEEKVTRKGDTTYIEQRFVASKMSQADLLAGCALAAAIVRTDAHRPTTTAPTKLQNPW